MSAVYILYIYASEFYDVLYDMVAQNISKSKQNYFLNFQISVFFKGRYPASLYRTHNKC